MGQPETALGQLVRARPWIREVPPDQPSPREFVAANSVAQSDVYRWQRFDGSEGEAPLIEAAMRDPNPTPPFQLREDYGPSQAADLPGLFEFWKNGLREFQRLADLFRRAGVPRHERERLRLLDFGCATGRMLRNFALNIPGLRAWGCDFDALNVDWMRRRLTGVAKVFQNHSIPHLPLDDHSFDGIIALSVFTHMDLLEDAWLLELRRILRPGGVLIATIHCEKSWTKLPQKSNERIVKAMAQATPDRGDLAPVDELLAGPMPQGRTVWRAKRNDVYAATTFHTSDYVRRVWGSFFDIVEIAPSYQDPRWGMQTAVVLRRPEDA